MSQSCERHSRRDWRSVVQSEFASHRRCRRRLIHALFETVGEAGIDSCDRRRWYNNTSVAATPTFTQDEDLAWKIRIRAGTDPRFRVLS